MGSPLKRTLAGPRESGRVHPGTKGRRVRLSLAQTWSLDHGRVAATTIRTCSVPVVPVVVPVGPGVVTVPAPIPVFVPAPVPVSI